MSGNEHMIQQKTVLTREEVESILEVMGTNNLNTVMLKSLPTGIADKHEIVYIDKQEGKQVVKDVTDYESW